MFGIAEVVRSFIFDESGFVKQRDTIGLSWTVGVLLVAAVFWTNPTAVPAGSASSQHGTCSSSTCCADTCSDAGHCGSYCDGGACYCW